MKTNVQQPQKAPQTIQSKPKAANQSSVQKILQRYQEQTLQMAELDEDELLQGKFKNAVQLMELDEDEEISLQGKFVPVQREVPEDEEELLQGKFEIVQREVLEDDELLQGKFENTTQLEDRQNSPLGDRGVNNTGLPDNLKTGIENLSGYSMDDVRMHYNSDKPAQLQALAYTQGTDIHVAPGQEKHLPHEAWHVVQQKQGRVQPTMQLQGVNVNDNEGLEREADRMGGNSEYSGNLKSYNILHTNVDDKIIQGKFWLKKNEDYEWHNENVNENLYVNTGKTKRGWIFSYPVYIERVLDLTAYPTTTSEDAAKTAKQSGYIPEDLTQDKAYLETTNSIYAQLEEDQQQAFNEYIRDIKPYCKENGITSIIEGALKNVKKGSVLTPYLFGEYEKRQGEKLDNAKKIFINRLKLMTEYVKSVGEKEIDESKKIKDDYYIESTGSDPHANGEHALFLIKKTDNSKMLYKPHSLYLEEMFMGEEAESMISKFNGCLKTDEKLPTMKFNPEQHTEDFISRVGSFQHPLEDKNSVQKQFHKLGILEALSATFGITDLHGENVMFSENGPIIVDGECGGWYGGTGIKGSVANLGEDSLANSSALYLQEALGIKHQVKQNEYSEYFKKGIEKGENKLIQNKESVMEAYREQIQQIDSFRIVPIATNELAADLDTYINGTDPKELAKGRYSEVLRHMQSKSWAFNDKERDNEQVNIYKNYFIMYYSAALQAGTLPAFTFQLKPKGNILAGSILLDGNVIGDVGIDDENLLRRKFVGRANSQIDNFKNQRITDLKEKLWQTFGGGWWNYITEDKSQAFASIIIKHISEKKDINRESLKSFVDEKIQNYISYWTNKENRYKEATRTILAFPIVQSFLT